MNINCLLCGGTLPPISARSKKADAYVVKNRNKSKESSTSNSKLPPTNIADSVIVYTLGVIKSSNGSEKVQLDVYSSVNGLHIRTIPGIRWSNPQYIGAGAGYLAVVDRFADYDIARITDEYGGAGSEGFDQYGMPLSSVKWDGLADINYFQSPQGTQITGVGIMPNSVLVAGLSGNSFSIATGDISGNNGPLYTGTVDFSQEPLAASLGPAVGSFTYFTNDEGPTGNIAIGLSWSAAKGGYVVVFDYIKSKIKGLLGLGNALKPTCVHESRGVVSVLMCDITSGNAVQVVRFLAQDPTYAMAGIDSDTSTPAQYTYPISQTFQQYAVPAINVSTGAALQTYRDIAAITNAYPATAPYNTPAGEGVGSAGPDSPLFTTISPSTDSVAANDSRTQIAGTITTTQYNGQQVQIPVGIVPLNDTSGLIGFSGYNGTITEIYQKLTGNVIDPTQVIFRCVHASNYDWLSTGGFSYASITTGTQPSPTINLSSSIAQPSIYTNGLYPFSVATDLSGALGVLAPLPDLKVVLVDALNGLAIYNSPKPMGYTYFGGAYASIMPCVTENDSATTSSADAVATTLDGIMRPGLTGVILTQETPTAWMTYVPAYSNSLDLNSPWSLFTRQGAGKTATNVNLTSATWTTQDTQDETGANAVQILLPQWRNLKSILTVSQNGPQGVFFYPGPANQADLPNEVPTLPVLTCTDGGSGYFSLNLPQEQTTLCAQYETNIGDLTTQMQQQQALLSTLQKTGTTDQIAAQQNVISSTQTQIDNYNTLLSTCDISDPANMTFDTPEAITSAPYQIDTSPTQVLDPVLGVQSDNVTFPVTGLGPKLLPWQTVSVPSENPALDDINGDKRAIAISPNIRTWVAVSVKLDAWAASYASQGCTSWQTPETKKGGLGQLIGSLIGQNETIYPEIPCCAIPGNIYESGLAAEDANPVWEVEVLFNGASPASIATLVTAQEQIDGQAPEDLTNVLDYLFQAAKAGFGDVDPQVGQHTADIYFTDQIINTIQINVKLLNVATYLYRTGWETTSYGSGYNDDMTWNGEYRSTALYGEAYWGGPVTYTYGCDPGFYWGNNCEAFCYGNIPCYAFLFSGFGLCQNDPQCALVTNVVWEGTATYTVPQTNPYTEKGIGVGSFLFPSFTFELNGGLFQYAVDLSAGTPGPGSTIPTGSCNGVSDWYSANGGIS
jgi:hypothetical protein